VNGPLTTRKAGFRPEIEGLRAVAAILVAIFHIWLQRVSGGVDVFFVVSGFLISSGLLAEADRTGSIRFLSFWGRLVKRLFPSAMLVLFSVVVAALFWLPQSRWRATIEQVAAAATYTENWLLSANAVDYLARHQGTSPLQHFWALSVQGQFYLAWPVVFAAALKAAARWRVPYRTPLRVLLFGMFCASFAFSVYLTAHNQPLAYLHTLTRVWEFCMGSMLAMTLPSLRLPRALKVGMGWTGLVAILACGMVLQVSRVFPGYAALWPTLAAVLVISAGTTGSVYGVDRLLSSKPMVYLGGISYGIYLWHFPLLIFFRIHAEPNDLGMATSAGILAASILLAAATDRWVEGPVRRSAVGREGPIKSLMLGGACLAPVILALACWSLVYLHLQHHRASTPMQAGNSDHPGASALEAGYRYHGDRNAGLVPGPLAVAEDREKLTGDACDQPASAMAPMPCEVTGSGGQFTVAVVGGSHSSQWIPALKDIADRAGWRVITFTKSNCPFFIGSAAGEKPIPSCPLWNTNVLDQLVALKPNVVFMTSTRFDSDIADEFVPEGYLQAWKALETHGIHVVALRDNPDFEFDASACVELHGAEADVCSMPRGKLLETPSPVALLTDVPTNVRFIDLSDYFCDRTRCRPVVGNVLVYRHMNHITATYVRTLAPMLEREFDRAILTFESVKL
jgi:peptidoglycan/LPS O-acetylase OafA/YrhL